MKLSFLLSIGETILLEQTLKICTLSYGLVGNIVSLNININFICWNIYNAELGDPLSWWSKLMTE